MTDVNIAITTGVGADTYLQLYNHLNGGTSTVLLLNANWSILFRFDLSSIPAGSICTAATLKLRYTYGLGTKMTDLFVYKIADANGDWIEGTKNGTTAGAGEPSYYGKTEDGAGAVVTPWAGSAGLRTAGTDYINTILATLNFGNGDNQSIEIPFNANGLAVIQSWFGAATNNGLKMIQNSGSYSRYCSKQNATEAYRPVLAITYTEAGSLLKINMNAQMQNLSGGM